MKPILSIICALSATVEAFAAPTAPVNFVSLLEEMTNREVLPVHPEGGHPYASLQASSYDRRATAPEEAGWFSNQDWAAPDRPNFIREESNAGRTEWVLLESEGPGAIVRFWGGGFPQNGILRFYIDGDSEPVLSGIASELLGRDLAGFGEVLSSATVQLAPDGPKYNTAGFNLYAPIPYAKHMKVTYQVKPDLGDERPHFWYNINYREYGEGVQVESFSIKDIEQAAAQLKAVNAQLGRPAEPRADDKVTTERRHAVLQPGETLELAHTGSGALKRINITGAPESLAAALKTAELVIAFDGQETVQSPMGALFATGLDRLNIVQTYFHHVDPDSAEMTTYWVMPFQQEVRIQVRNRGDQPLEMQLECVIGDWQWSPHTMYFHAGYHACPGIKIGREERAMDWNYVSIEGKGLYVGDSLEVNNPVASWWGEGDEKIYVDGAIFPTHFGTGTEDYYGYAWGTDFLFNQPFISQPQAEGNDPSFKNPPGVTINTRVRMLDAIPFKTSLKVDMELWHQRPDTTIDFGVAVFWYGAPGTTGQFHACQP